MSIYAKKTYKNVIPNSWCSFKHNLLCWECSVSRSLLMTWSSSHAISLNLMGYRLAQRQLVVSVGIEPRTSLSCCIIFMHILLHCLCKTTRLVATFPLNYQAWKFLWLTGFGMVHVSKQAFLPVCSPDQSWPSWSELCCLLQSSDPQLGNSAKMSNSADLLLWPHSGSDLHAEACAAWSRVVMHLNSQKYNKYFAYFAYISLHLFCRTPKQFKIAVLSVHFKIGLKTKF